MRYIKRQQVNNFLLSLFLLSVALLFGCVTDSKRTYQTTQIGDGIAAPHIRQTLSGSYLAGLHAQRQQDWPSASKFISQTLDFDGTDKALTHRAFLLALGAGRMRESERLATELVGEADAELATIFLILTALKNKQVETAQKYIDLLPEAGFGQYTRALLQSWSAVSAGDLSEALDALPKNEAGVHTIELYDLHAGLLSEYMGDPQKAKFWFDQASRGELTLRSALAIGNFYERHGEKEKALDLYRNLNHDQPGNVFIRQAISRVEKEQSTPSSFILNPIDGAAMAVFDLAAMLFGREAYDSALIFARLAEHANPTSDFVHILLGDIMVAYKRYDEALLQYQFVNKNDDLFLTSRLRIAEIMEISGRLDDAVNLLYSLSEKEAVRTNALTYIGDLYRRNHKFSEAITAYDQALAGIDTLTSQHWPVIYARGIALERTNQWPRAEKDLLKALEFQPQNPMVLNYLGYAWAEQGKNLDRALDMIHQAMSIRPNDGYIIDSFGWVLFKLGRFEKSVTFLERAVELVPNDVVLNDHLGDAYWRAGRESEAKFQWVRVYNLSNDSQFRDVVKNKLRHGLSPEPLLDTSISLD